MRCDEVDRAAPGAGRRRSTVELAVERHIETCLRCQAELARYRRLLRTLALLRTRYVEPTPGPARRDPRRARPTRPSDGARRTMLSGRRLAYAGAIGGSARSPPAPPPRC